MQPAFCSACCRLSLLTSSFDRQEYCGVNAMLSWELSENFVFYISFLIIVFPAHGRLNDIVSNVQPGAGKLVLWRHWMHCFSGASSDVKEPISLHQAVQNDLSTSLSLVANLFFLMNRIILESRRPPPNLPLSQLPSVHWMHARAILKYYFCIAVSPATGVVDWSGFTMVWVCLSSGQFFVISRKIAISYMHSNCWLHKHLCVYVVH